MKRSAAFIILSLILVYGLNPLEAQGTTDYFNLERSLNQALQTNFQIRKAREEVRRRRGVFIEARAALLPQVNVTGVYKKLEDDLRRGANGLVLGSEKQWTARVEGTQSLFVGGQDISRSIRDSLLNQAAFEFLKSVINNVVFAVHQQFYQVLVNRAQVVVREQAIELLEQELQSARRRLAAGTVSNFDALRAEVALANAQTPYIRARNAYKISIEDFRRLLGLPHKRGDKSVDILLEGELAFFETSQNLEIDTEKALTQRPELKQLEKEFKAGQRDVWAARAQFLPDVKAYASYEEGTTTFSIDQYDTVEGWEAGLRGDWKLFNSGASVGQVKQAAAARNISEIDLEEERLIVELEAHRSYYTLVESIELVHASNKVVEQAEESLRLAQARVDAGVATQLDLLDSQVALTDARTNKIQALYEFNASVARHRRAMGEFATE